MRRLIATVSFIAVVGAAGAALAQQPDEATIAARMAAQKAALAPLSRIDGEWRGTAWIADRKAPLPSRADDGPSAKLLARDPAIKAD